MGNITRNFSSYELAPGYKWDQIPAAQKNKLIILAKDLLQPGRDKLNEIIPGDEEIPIILTSVYRSPAHNKAAGGAKLSQHMQGDASDLITPVYTGLQFFEFWVKYFHHKIGGIGLYHNENIKAKFIHIDMRKKDNLTSIVSWYFNGSSYLSPTPLMKQIAKKYGVTLQG